MELSGGLVLGLQPVGRKSRTVVHCQSEWPMRVQCDGQPRAAHWPFVSGFLGLFLCLYFSSDTHTLSLTQVPPPFLVITMWQD